MLMVALNHKMTAGNVVEAALLEDISHNVKAFFMGETKGYNRNQSIYNAIYKAHYQAANGLPEHINIDGLKIPLMLESEGEQVEYGIMLLETLLNDIVKNEELSGYYINEGLYEYGRASISPGDIVVDAGANIGFFSAIASLKGATVYAFEPFDYVIEHYLSKTAALNQNISICKYALADKRGEQKFYNDSEYIGKGHLDNENYRCELLSDAQTVQTITLDEFVQENNLPRVDFIKADIEGAERYMLMGAQNVLREFAPKLSICTYHLPDDPEVLKQLVLQANPKYVIEEKWKKLYAYVPK
jgi:FkbM family methyltransferase